MARPAQDVLIIGAGAIGCSIAWRLARAGLTVTLVERTRPGAEASSAAAGILSAQAEAEEDGVFFSLLSRSERLYGEFVRELEERTRGDLGHGALGLLEVAFDEAEEERLARKLAWQRRAGCAVEALDAGAVRQLEPNLGEEIGRALFFPEAARIDPPRLVQALWDCAREVGCRWIQGEARSLRLEGGRVAGVELRDGPLEAPVVVVAAGAWSALIAGIGLDPGAIRPLRGQLARLEADPLPMQRILFGAGGYLVPHREGRLVVGSTMEDVGYDKSVTAPALELLLARAARLCPSLARRPVGALWAGLRPMTRDGHPALGPVPGVPGLHLAVGHGRNGILLTPATAEIVALGILGSPPELPEALAAARLFG